MTRGNEKGEKEEKKKQKIKYLFFNKLTLELVGVLEALTVHLDGGAVSLSDVTQTLLLQLSDLWDLVFTTSTTKRGAWTVRLESLLHVTNRMSAILNLSSKTSCGKPDVCE